MAMKDLVGDEYGDNAGDGGEDGHHGDEILSSHKSNMVVMSSGVRLERQADDNVK